VPATTDDDNLTDRERPQPQLAVWLCSPPEHRHARGAAAVADIARHTVDHYTDPADLVLDPDCRDGILVEQAALLGRRAIGASGDHDLAACAANRLSRHARARAQTAVVIDSSLGHLPHFLATEALPQLLRRYPSVDADNVVTLPQQRFTLILTELTLPHDHARGYIREDPPLEQIAHTCPPLLKPGGFLALLLSSPLSRRPDQPRRTIRLLEQAGLSYWQHVIALCGTTELVHRDLLVFRRPDAPASANAHVEARERRAA
jgi:hypothetical protein